MFDDVVFDQFHYFHRILEIKEMVNLPGRNLTEGKVLGIMQDKAQAVKLFLPFIS